MMTQVVSLRVCLSFPFSFLSFPLPLIFFGEEGRPTGPLDPRLHMVMATVTSSDQNSTQNILKPEALKSQPCKVS